MATAQRSTRRFLIALGVLAAALAAGAFIVRATYGGGRLKAVSIAMDTPLGATEVRVGIEPLIADYLADEKTADGRYRYKTVEVTGVMMGLDESDPQIVTVNVGKQPGNKEYHCACQGGPRLGHAAARFSEGQPITVRGRFAGLMMMRMVLLNCEIAG